MRIEASNLQEALVLAAAEFECSVIDIEYEVIQLGKSGFMGLFQKNAIIEARSKKRKFDKKFTKNSRSESRENSRENSRNFENRGEFKGENSRFENRSNFEPRERGEFKGENREKREFKPRENRNFNENSRENLRSENRFENRGNFSENSRESENRGEFRNERDENSRFESRENSRERGEFKSENSRSFENSRENRPEFKSENSRENRTFESRENSAPNAEFTRSGINTNTNEFGFDTNSSFADRADLSDKFKPRDTFRARYAGEFADKLDYEVPQDDDFSDIKAVEKPKYKIIANDENKPKADFSDKFSDKYANNYNEDEAIFDVGEKPRKDFIDKNSNFKNPAFENLAPKENAQAAVPKSKYVVRNDEIFNSFHKESDANPALYIDEIKMQLDKLLKAGEFDIKIADIKVFDEHSIYIKLDGADAALLIGREGYRYKALSYLLHNWINSRYNILIRLEIADFLRNQSQTMDFYLRSVIEKVEMMGRAQTKPLDGVLVKIALEKLRARFPNKYVGIRQNGEEKFVIINDFFKKDE